MIGCLLVLQATFFHEPGSHFQASDVVGRDRLILVAIIRGRYHVRSTSRRPLRIGSCCLTFCCGVSDGKRPIMVRIGGFRSTVGVIKRCSRR